MSGHEIASMTTMQVFTWGLHPGIETVVKAEGGTVGHIVYTAGVSIGSHEVKFYYDGGEHQGGFGAENVMRAIGEKVTPVPIGTDAPDQYVTDQAMLGTCLGAEENISGGAIAVVSAVALKAGAENLGIPLHRRIGGANTIYLPVPGVPVATGHKRYGGGVTTPDPKSTYSFMYHGFDSFLETSYVGWEVQERRHTTIKKTGIYPPNYYDLYIIPEGHFKSDEELWALVTRAIQGTGYGGRIGIQIDVTSDCYYDRKQEEYFGLFSAEPKTKEDMLELCEHAVANYPFVIIEDPFFENDYGNHARLAKRVDTQIVEDDLSTTTPSRVAYGASIGAANTVLLKVNQVGTIGETLKVVRLAYRNGYGTMPCKSRGEGAAVADCCTEIDACAVREMIVSLVADRFLEIERELGNKARFSDTAGLQGR